MRLLGLQQDSVHILTFKNDERGFPDSPVVKTAPSNAGGVGLIPGQGAKIPHASWPKSKT